MSEHPTEHNAGPSPGMTAEQVDEAIASHQAQLDFLVKILRALDDQSPRKTAARAEYEDTLLRQISDLTQELVELMEQRKSIGGPGSGAGAGSRTTIPPPAEPSAEQDAMKVMKQNVPLEETERDRLIAAEKAEALKKKAFRERQSQIRAEREQRLAARTKRFLRKWLGLNRN